jgi:hypothetical protein
MIEAGRSGSAEGAARVAAALDRRAEMQLIDPRRRNQRPNLDVDLVHSAMGEYEARHLRAIGHPVGMDEPYQHYQFAGRADVVAWNLEDAAFLHIENRTRFPDFQEMAGAYNAKKAYLGASLAERLGVRKWRSETHVLAGLWSSEILHSARLRSESFRSLCPDRPTNFEQWWTGVTPPAGKSSSMVVLDPLASGRQRPFVGLDEAVGGVRPRYRGYSDFVAALNRTLSA